MTRLKHWLKGEVAPGLLLAAFTAAALVWSNSSAAASYFHLLHLPVGPLSVHEWVNDALMALFFFSVGMEIKRELLEGQLAKPKLAAFPVAAALGGMIAPALIYFFLNSGNSFQRGWGIPMATDIAFAIGVLSLFGKRVPSSLKVFLLALATVDDLGAVIVIAFFYTETVVVAYLGLAVAASALLFLLRQTGWGRLWLYLSLGIAVWGAVFLSGVHATIAGVILAWLMPLRSGSRRPIDIWVARLHPWIGFGVMPVFALANAGVSFSGGANLFSSSVFWGVGLGLLLGKPLGIFAATYLAVISKAAVKPTGIAWLAIFGVALLGGIGFTMALFVANLALPEAELNIAKMAVLSASLLAAILGALSLHCSLRKRNF